MEMGGPELGRVEYLDKPIEFARLASAARAAVDGSPRTFEGTKP